MDVSTQLDGVVAAARAVLAGSLRGAYLHGSAVGSGLRPASDLDVLLVLGRALGERERDDLTAALLPLSGRRHGARPLEVVAVVADHVRPWRYPPECDYLYGEWLRADAEAGRLPRPDPTPDLALLLDAVRREGRALHGPPAADLFDPPPAADLRRATLHGVPGLLDDLDDDRRNVLLTLARVWATVATGAVLGKAEAATWALERLPTDLAAPLAHARELYLTTSYADERWPAGTAEAARTTAEALAENARKAEAPRAPGRAHLPLLPSGPGGVQ